MKNLLILVLLILLSCTTKVKESSKIVVNHDTKKIDSLVLCVNNSSSNKVKIDIGENKEVSFFLQKPRNFIVSSELVLLNFYEIFEQNDIKFERYNLYDELNSKINYLSNKDLHAFSQIKKQADSLFDKIKINDTTNLDLYFSNQNFNPAELSIFIKNVNQELKNKTPKIIGFEILNLADKNYFSLYFKGEKQTFLLMSKKENEKYKIDRITIDSF